MTATLTSLAGQTALVTGASRGIGQAVALRLAADGATVAVHYGFDRAGAEATLAEIEAAGGAGFVVGAELGVPGDVDTLFDRLGDRPLDILVNNAAALPIGQLDATTTDIEGTTPEQFDHLFAVNVRAPYFIIQRALPLLRDGGRIITLSTVTARVAAANQTSFSMSKAAIETMSRTLANQLGVRGITVNAVASGATRTETNVAQFETPGIEELLVGVTALNRLGQAADVADVVHFLASPAGRWVTGQVIDASGGMFLGPRV